MNWFFVFLGSPICIFITLFLHDKLRIVFLLISVDFYFFLCAGKDDWSAKWQQPRGKRYVTRASFWMVARLDRYGEERMSYIQYRWGGRGTKEIEEPVGRESESIAASKEKRYSHHAYGWNWASRHGTAQAEEVRTPGEWKSDNRGKPLWNNTRKPTRESHLSY